MIEGFKLFRTTRDGLKSLFIDRSRILPKGKWLKARQVRTKGYAYRPGWHILLKPDAPHLSRNGREMRKVEVRGILRRETRPTSQGGEWLTAKWLYIKEKV